MPDTLVITYEDNHVIAAVKPPGMPAQADSSGDEDMLSLVKGYIKRRYDKKGEAYAGLLHRLDRPVGGLMLFARTSKAASRLSGQLSRGEMTRSYLALVRGSPPGGSLSGYMAKDSRLNISRVYDCPHAGAKEARLSYERLEEKGGESLIAVTLGTGRSHQIRAQMAHAGYPLIGDVKYGGAAVGALVKLWAYKLVFKHPVSRDTIELKAKWQEIICRGYSYDIDSDGEPGG